MTGARIITRGSSAPRHPRPAAEPRTQEPAGENLDAAENEEEHAESQHRSHGGHRGGRPVKKVYEEFINDPYCE